MKNWFYNILSVFLIINVLIGGLLWPLDTSAATIKQGDTLGTLRQKLRDLQAKQSAQRNKKQQTQSEINANTQKMHNAEAKLQETKDEISSLEEQITNTNSEIDELKKETEGLLLLYQQLESENIYVSYVTGASSMTELIMRLEAVNQLTEYNKDKLENLEILIKSNEKLNKEMADYQVKLDQRIVAYEESIEALGDQLAELEEGAITIADEIKSMQELIKYYENMGCKEDQDLIACVSIANNAGWLKPVSKGKITSLYGPRKSPTAGASSYHRGIDIGISDGTKVYATAAGVVGAIVRRSSCGGNMVYIWANVNGKPYTYVFMHMLEIHVSVGDKVTTSTVVGLSGGGSTATRNGGYDKCTTGSHLHYGLASGGFYGKDKALSKFNANTINPPGYPGIYQWFYTR